MIICGKRMIRLGRKELALTTEIQHRKRVPRAATESGRAAGGWWLVPSQPKRVDLPRLQSRQSQVVSEIAGRLRVLADRPRCLCSGEGRLLETRKRVVVRKIESGSWNRTNPKL